MSSITSIVYLFFQTLETESRERQQTLDQLRASLTASQRAQHVSQSVCCLIDIITAVILAVTAYSVDPKLSAS